jgi:hypothetical protein
MLRERPPLVVFLWEEKETSAAPRKIAMIPAA